jgi:hypothetical protein
MNALAVTLDEVLNGEDCPVDQKKIGFILLTAKFGDIKNGRVNYISNGERSDMIKMMEELLGRFKKTEKEARA